jgi:flagellar protein FliS
MTNLYQQAYLSARIQSASPLELVCLAYDGAIEAIENARQFVRERRIQERSRAITKAQQLVLELIGSLDYTRGGELSVTLARLYDYILDRLREANFRQIEEPLAEAQRLLETVGGSWRQLAATETTVPEVSMSAYQANAPGARPIERYF